MEHAPRERSISVVILGAVPELRENVDRAELKRLVDSGEKLWVNFDGFSEEETPILLEDFHFHPLSVDDCLDTIAYPKLEEFPEYLFLILHAVANHGRKQLTIEIDFFITHQVLVSVHLRSCPLIENFRTILLRKGTPQLVPDQLFEAISSQLVDDYFPILDQINTNIDKLERVLFEGQMKKQEATSLQVTHLFLNTKKQNARLRRLLTAQRDVFRRLGREDYPFISHQTQLYLRDVFDRLWSVTEMLDLFRDILASTLEAHLSIVSVRLNEVLKILTVVTVIFLPLMLITGMFGMNFRYMPLIEEQWGYPLALITMGLIVAGSIWFFRHKRWL